MRAPIDNLKSASPSPIQSDPENRKGATAVLSALFMAVMLGVCAFAVDIGYITNTQTELRRAVDAGALAGAGVLVNGPAAADPVVKQYVKANLVGARAAKDSEISVTAGNWSSGAFFPTQNRPSALRVVVQRQQQPLFFARVFGRDTFDISAEAIAQYQPRDIMLTLDFSGSMNDDSTYAARSTLGIPFVTSNLQQIYGELGSPTYGNMTFNGVFINSTNSTTLRNTLGLTNVPYPYPGGSWTEFFSHVQNNSDLNGAGLRKYYGYKTLIHYWLVDRAKHSETPSLANVSAQPVTALKDSVEVFLSFLNQNITDDRLGLSIYNSSNGTAILESPLTADYNAVNVLLQARQAGHYDAFTNIGAGMQTSRLQLQNNGRAGAFRMIVLMTDGIANRPTNTTTAKALVLSEANLCAAAKIPIVTISLGAGADKPLMQQVADITGGYHFNIPGGQTGSQYQSQLTQIFGQIAGSHPLRLVK